MTRRTEGRRVADAKRRKAFPWRKLYSTRAWKIRRAKQLASVPWCEPCKRMGKSRPATVANHKEPHRGDRHLFFHGALESQCKSCHDSATQRAELEGFVRGIGEDGWPMDSHHPFLRERRAARGAGYSIPRGVSRSAIPVVLVCGPPASGKTTYVRLHAQPGDTVIDLDEICLIVGGRRWDRSVGVFKRAMAYRDKMICGLAAKRRGVAYLIVGAPTEAERSQWVAALGNVRVVVLKTPEDECQRRISSDPLRAHAASQLSTAVKEWWADANGARHAR